MRSASVSSKLIPQAHALNTYIVEDSPVILEKLVSRWKS